MSVTRSRISDGAPTSPGRSLQIIDAAQPAALAIDELTTEHERQMQ